MIVFAIPLKHLASLSGAELREYMTEAEIVAHVRQQFAFLGSDVRVEIRDGTAFISRPLVGSKVADEATQLVEKAGRRAQAGEFSRAVDLYERALKLNPALQSTWRDLAMAQMERGLFDAARDALIDALRLDPQDAWSFVVLANLYAKQKKDFAQARRFYQRALELKPNDPWALNGFAAAVAEQGDHAEALRLFDRAIEADHTFANAWCGKALVLLRDRKPGDSIAVLETMFREARSQDTRSTVVFDEGRRLFAAAQAELAKSAESDAFKSVEDYCRTIERESGFPVKTEEGPLPGQIAAMVQIAWKHGRDYHKIVLRKSAPPQQDAYTRHLLAHELTHIRLETEARGASRNRFFITTAQTREAAIRAIEPDLRRLQHRGYAPDAIAKVTQELVQGVCGFVFNCPLDMLIERRLRAEMPVLRPAQFLSLAKLAEEARHATFHEEIRKLTPPRIWRATSALNGAFALFLDDLYGGATRHWGNYVALEIAPLAQKLWAHWSTRTSDSLVAGDEYQLVDEFGEMLGMREWFSWKPDVGAHEVASAENLSVPIVEGSTNPELLRDKHPAAVWFLLDALKRFTAMQPEQVRPIVFEIAMLGREGLDYASPGQKYRLRALPGETFSGLHLMCLMFAGSKQIAPEMDTGMDLEAPFLTALELFNRETGGQDRR